MHLSVDDIIAKSLLPNMEPTIERPLGVIRRSSEISTTKFFMTITSIFDAFILQNIGIDCLEKSINEFHPLGDFETRNKKLINPLKYVVSNTYLIYEFHGLWLKIRKTSIANKVLQKSLTSTLHPERMMEELDNILK